MCKVYFDIWMFNKINILKIVYFKYVIKYICVERENERERDILF